MKIKANKLTIMSKLVKNSHNPKAFKLLYIFKYLSNFIFRSMTALRRAIAETKEQLNSSCVYCNSYIYLILLVSISNKELSPLEALNIINNIRRNSKFFLLTL